MDPFCFKISQKTSFRTSKQLWKFRTQKTEKAERDNCGGPNGIGGWPPTSTWIRKMNRDKFPMNAYRRRRDILKLVHTYLCGPMQTRSLGGAYYFSLFIDYYIRFTWVYLLRKKSHTFEYFKELRILHSG